MNIRCFWLAPSDQVEVSLRRFADGDCAESGCGYHNASAVIGRSLAAECPQYTGTVLHGDLWPHADPRWPMHCACGYAFGDRDYWQFNPEELLTRSDSGERITWHAAPSGAMRDAFWLAGLSHYRRIGGITLMLKTPGGDWIVDGPSYKDGEVQNTEGWQRTGGIPDVTAQPSILIPGRYHGWLRSGYLVEC